MSDQAPFGRDALDEARERYPSAVVELHDGTLVIGPQPDAVARAAIAALIASLLPHIETAGFWIEGAAFIERDDDNARFFAIALWAIDPQQLPELVVYVLSAHERLRWARGRVNRALELGVRYGVLIDPATRTVLVFDGVERTAHTNGPPLAELLPDWHLDTTTLFGPASPGA